jgi:putative FmdB family regulatory protein
MPTYEYACTSCGHHLEIFQSFSEEPLTTCPECGGDLRKVFGSIGIVLKGSGFYRTDSRTGSNGKQAGKEAPKEKEKEKKEKETTPAGADGGSAASGSGTSTSASTPSSSSSATSPSAAVAAS